MDDLPGTPPPTRVALHAVHNVQLAPGATPAKRAAAVYTPLKPAAAAPSPPHALAALELSPLAEAASPAAVQPGGEGAAYRVACHLPVAELRAALSGGGELYHQPISALESDSWVRELSADYIETAGWLEGRCAPIDGGSYTLAFGDGEHQLSFVLRVGLADGVPPTSVSWRLNGLDAEAKWLPARARVAEVDDGPPQARMYFDRDGLELLLARAETQETAGHSVRLRLQRLGGRASSQECSLELRSLDADVLGEEADGSMLCGSCSLSALWQFETATGWEGTGVHLPEGKAKQIHACLIAEVVEGSRTIGFARVPISLQPLLPQAFEHLLRPDTEEDGLHILRSLLHVVATRVEGQPDAHEPSPRGQAAPAAEQIAAAIESVRSLFLHENPYAVGLATALLLSQQHWPVVVLETAQSEVLVAVHSSASTWQPLAPCLAVREDHAADGSHHIEQLQELLDRKEMPFASVNPDGQTAHLLKEVVSGLDIFSLLLAAGFDLPAPDAEEDADESAIAAEEGDSAADEVPTEEAVVRSFWMSSVRNMQNKNCALLSILNGGDGSGLVIAAESRAMCASLLAKLQGTDAAGCTLRWFDSAADDGLSSTSLLSTILESCQTAFLHNDGREVASFCARAALTYALDKSESFDCLLALGEQCIDPSSAAEEDDGDPLLVPIVFVPVTLHSVATGTCKITGAGLPFLNPLLLAALPPSTGANCLGRSLAQGQPAASILPLPEGLPLGEPGRASQRVASTEILALDQALWPFPSLFRGIRKLAAPSTPLSRPAPIILASLDGDQESLTSWWSTHDGPMAAFGRPGSGRTRALANLAGNVVAGGGRVLYVVPDAAAASSFSAMLEEFNLREFAVNLSSGPSAMRCLRERFAKVRELAGSQQSSIEEDSAGADYKRKHRVFLEARERLQKDGSSAERDANMQLSLRQFLDAQTACVAAGRGMVAAQCRARLLAAAKTLTQGKRPDLAAACSSLLSTDSTDDDFVDRSAEFAELLLMLSPVVVATPADVAVWLACSLDAERDSALFTATLLDDAQNMLPVEASRSIMLSASTIIAVGTEAPQPVLSRLRKRGLRATSASERTTTTMRHSNAYEVVIASAAGGGQVPFDPINMTGNYCSMARSKDQAPSRLLPVPRRIDRQLGATFIRVDCGGAKSAGQGLLKRGKKGASKRSETRLANNMDAALKALQSALGAHRLLKEETIEPLRVHLRALRGGVVNIGEARDIAAEIARIARIVPHAQISIVAMSTAQMHLLQAVHKASSASVRSNTNVQVCTVFDLAAAGRCDVLILSATYGARSSIGGARGVSAQRLPAIITALCEAPRLQSVVFLSGGDETAWANTKPSSGFVARLGKSLQELVQPHQAQALSDSKTAPWINDLHEALRSTAQGEEDDDLDDWNLLQLPFRGELLSAIAHKSSIVFCHANLDQSRIRLEERFCVLSQLVGRWRWKKLHHVFSPQSMSDDAKQEHTSALLRDMCGLGRLLKLKVKRLEAGDVTLSVERKLSLLVPSDAVAGLSLVRSSSADGSVAKRVIPLADRPGVDADTIALFSDESSLLRAACDYNYQLFDGCGDEVVEMVTVTMPSESPDGRINIELAATALSSSAAQLIADVSVGSPSIHAVKDANYAYELKVLNMAALRASGDTCESDGAETAVDEELALQLQQEGVAWEQAITSATLTADWSSNGMYEFVVEELEQGQRYAVGVSVRNSVGRGPWTFSTVQMPEAVEDDQTNEELIDSYDCPDDFALDGESLGEFSDDDMTDFSTLPSPAPGVAESLPDAPNLQSDVATGTISWPEVAGCEGYEIHARTWDVSAPAAKWDVIAKCHDRRVVTARQLSGEEQDVDGMQVEVRIRTVASAGHSSWTHTSMHIRGAGDKANMTKIQLRLCASKRKGDIEMHIADLMVGGIMRLSGKLQQLDVSQQAGNSRITAKVRASLRLTFKDTEVELPMSVKKQEVRLNFKHRMVKITDDEEEEQWQASVRPQVSAPVDADCCFWSLLFSAVTEGAQAQIELEYSAGVPGSTFIPVGVQEFRVLLQAYDPDKAGRLDLSPHFLLEKHVLVKRSVQMLLESWSTGTVALHAMQSAICEMSSHCLSVQNQFVSAVLVRGRDRAEADPPLAEVLAAGLDRSDARATMLAAEADACEGEKVAVSVRSASGDATVQFNVATSISALQLKAVVALNGSFDVGMDEIRLVFSGKILNDAQTLAEAGVSKATTLNLFPTAATTEKLSLMSAVVQSLGAFSEAIELRPFPSEVSVKRSILAALGSLKASRPHVAGVADYLLYALQAGIESCGTDDYQVRSEVEVLPAVAATVRLPQMVADLVHNHGADWLQYLSPFLQVDTDDTAAGVSENMRQTVVDTMLALLLGGQPIALLEHEDESPRAWSFRASRIGNPELLPSSSAFVAVGTSSPGSPFEPHVLVPVSMGRGDSSMIIRKTEMSNAFFSPTFCPDLLPLHSADAGWARCSMQKWLAAAAGESRKANELSAVLFVASGERASDRAAEAPILDILQHHQMWSGSSNTTAYGLLTAGIHGDAAAAPQSDDAEMEGPPTSWRLRNPCQVGDADASQRHAIAEAVAGKSFVLRGPPGCGKTQTLANMVAALVQAGKTVCVVAKLPVALGVFAEKLCGMQQVSDGTGPSLRPLTTSFFTGKDGGKIRRGDDKQNAVTNDDRLKTWPVLRDLERFWSCEESGTESAAREMLRDGWRLPSSQPESLCPFYQQGIVGVQLVKEKQKKPKFVCSLCGKTQASEAPFVEHLESHASKKLWAPHFEKRCSYEATQWGEGTASAPTRLTDAASARCSSVAAAKLSAESELYRLDEQASRACHQLHSGSDTGSARQCCSGCPGSGCCISEVSPFEMMASVADSALRVASLRAEGSSSAAEDLQFFTLAQEFAQSHENGGAASCHSVLETVRAVKGASHSSVFEMLSLAAAQVREDGALERQIYQGLQDAGATLSRLHQRCEMVELCFQLLFLRGLARESPTDGERAASPWSLELKRRQACLDAVSAECESRLMDFVLRNPHVSEEMEAAFGVRGGNTRARRLVELLYPSLLDVDAAGSADEDPALKLRLLLKMFPVFCFTPEECARHLPAAFTGSDGEAGSTLFDVVLFDEASQLPTHEALGCLGRASQCIIVGDDQQLPPRDGCTGLLDDALIANMSLVPLTWHYRSAFRSLIHVSNEMFYHGSLQCVPSANDFLATTGSASGDAGLIRQEVGGPMESNYVYAKEIENFVNKRLRRLDPQLERVSYSATPQGFVNSEQAWRVLEELIRYMDEVRAGGLPMSAGIITLNRPQRQLIHLLVGAAKTRLGLVDAHNHAFVRPEGEAHARDQPLFIQSIDQIQGEEREIILLSMLLAPRRQANQHLGDEDEQGVDIFDQLEAGGTDGDADGEAGDGDAAAAAAPVAAPRAATAQRFQYSTIAHAHGDRLLNVGLSRAIRVMKIFYHPRMVAPPEHEVKNGKRVFGWLVRFLLRQPPNCPCSDCVARYRRLVPESAVGEDSPQNGAGDNDEQPRLWTAIDAALGRCGSRAAPIFGEGSAFAATEVGFGGGGVRIALAAQLNKCPPADATQPAATRTAPKAIAVLADSSAARHQSARDKISLPPMLQNRKVGWEHCAVLQTDDLLQRLATAPATDGCDSLGSAIDGWLESALQASVSAEAAPAPESSGTLRSLFAMPAAPVPVPGAAPPPMAVVKDEGKANSPKPGKPQSKSNLKLTVAQLKVELKKRGLKCSGRKAELEARLEEALDAEGAAAEPEAEAEEEDGFVDEPGDFVAAPSAAADQEPAPETQAQAQPDDTPPTVAPEAPLQQQETPEPEPEAVEPEPIAVDPAPEEEPGQLDDDWDAASDADGGDSDDDFADAQASEPAPAPAAAPLADVQELPPAPTPSPAAAPLSPSPSPAPAPAPAPAPEPREAAESPLSAAAESPASSRPSPAPAAAGAVEEWETPVVTRVEVARPSTARRAARRTPARPKYYESPVRKQLPVSSLSR